jgi:homospermidine synthase
VYYAYQPTDAALASVHEMRGKELDMHTAKRIIKNEIVSGMDELGVLLIGPGYAMWHGSQLTIDDARHLVPGESATSLQVAGSMLGALVWMIENPKMGYVEPEAIPFEKILAVGDKYWEPIVTMMSDWSPKKKVNKLFDRDFDEKNPFCLDNFRVWG